jgi:ribonucleotide monophosphatase NagD (HAD superfamily)
MTPEIAERVQNASGFIFDMDGTIALGDAASGGHKALPFATETLAAIRARGGHCACLRTAALSRQRPMRRRYAVRDSICAMKK